MQTRYAMTRTIEAIREDLAGFTKPQCPDCKGMGEPTLDDHGYFCERCGADLPNGAEFDDVLAELRDAPHPAFASG